MLPPETFTTLTAEEKNRFVGYFMADNRYFNDDARRGTELWDKIEPKPVYGSTSYIAVKTFRTDKEGKAITKDLPYDPVLADESFDMWSLGVSKRRYGAVLASLICIPSSSFVRDLVLRIAHTRMSTPRYSSPHHR